MERINERSRIAQKALNSLTEIVSEENPTAIQRFEYSFEAVWKAALR